VRVADDWRVASPVLLEKNLSRYGFFTATNSRTPLDHVKRATLRYELDGRIVYASVEIHPSPGLGLPTIGDQDKWFAFLGLLLRRWESLADATNPFAFSTPDLLRTLHLPTDSGENYLDVQRWLDVMSATTIVSHESVYFAGTRRWVRDRCRVFDRVVSAGCELEDGRTADRNYVWLSSWLLENLQHNHVIFLDLDQYLLLNRPIAKGLVPLLQPGLRAGRDRGWYARSYPATCEVLGMRHYTQRSKVLEKLEPALDELRHAQFISGWSIEPAKNGSDLKIVVHLDSHAALASAGPDPRAPRPSPETFLEQLTGRGLHRRTAERLLRRVPSTQPVQAQIAWFDRHVASAAGRSIRNRPAFLYRVIQEGLGDIDPADATEAANEPSPDRVGAALETHAEENWRLRRQLLDAYEDDVQRQITRYLDALPEEELRHRLDASAETLRREYPFLRNADSDDVEGPARAHLRRQVRQEITLRPLADFEREWEQRQAAEASA
jgi:hypothetical protein